MSIGNSHKDYSVLSSFGYINDIGNSGTYIVVWLPCSYGREVLNAGFSNDGRIAAQLSVGNEVKNVTLMRELEIVCKAVGEVK